MRAAYLLSIIIMLGLFGGCSDDNKLPGGSGFIEATETLVSAEVTGRVTALHVKEGDRVPKGAIIAQLDTVNTRLRLDQAGATKRATEKRVKIALINIEQAKQTLILAKKEYERAQSLIKSGSVNKQLYDQAETTYQQAVLSLKQSEAAHESAWADLDKVNSDIGLLEQQFRDCFPRSPQSGFIVSKFLETGEWAAVGRPIVKIAALDTVWVKIYLPPGDLTAIRLGGRARIDPEDGRATPMEGTISWISSEAEFTPKNVQTKEARADLVYAVKITIPNADEALKIGMPVSVTIP
jgi:HlyD family secretion protein